MRSEIWYNNTIKSFIKKAERKEANSNLSEKNFYNWGIKEMKKTLKKLDVSGFTFVLFNKDFNLLDLSDLDLDFKGLDINEIVNLPKQELKNLEKELKPYLKDILPQDQAYSIKLNSFNLSKNTNDNVYLSATTKISYAINDIVSLKGDGIIYMTAKNNSLYIFYEECIVNCQNLKKRFEKLIKPVVDQSSKKTNNISNNTKKNSNIVDQLEQLNELYKSGVLSKEEFEKAKKKILN